MRVKISRSYEYPDRDISPIESFRLEVEKDEEDGDEAVANIYLKLRKILLIGLKEEA